MKSIVLDQEQTIKQKLFGGIIIASSLTGFFSRTLFVLVFIVFIFGLIVFGISMKIKIKCLF